jgi:hypothetical protein
MVFTRNMKHEEKINEMANFMVVSKKGLWNKIVLPLLPFVIQRKIQCNWRSTNGKCNEESVVRTMNEFIEIATMIRYLRLGN